MDDLYSDLDTSVHATGIHEWKKKYEKLNVENEALRQEAAALQRANQELGQQTQTLEQNIARIYHTARNEIERKNKQIDALRRRH